MFRFTPRRSTVVPVAAVALAAALAGCGGSASGASPSTHPTALDVSVDGTHFTGVPHTVHPGTVTLSFRNTGDGPHMAAVGRLADGHTADEILPFLASPQGRQGPPPWLRLVGGVDDLDPGHQGSWTGSLGAGNYVLLSLSPDAQGRPDVADGMLAPFAAQGSPVQAKRPATGATVTLGSGGTLTMTGLPAGTAALELVNDDDAARTVDITSIKPGRTYDDVMQEAQQGNGVPPSLVKLGGTSVPPHGSVVVGIEPAAAGTTYVVFDIAHVAQGAIAHRTAG